MVGLTGALFDVPAERCEAAEIVGVTPESRWLASEGDLLSAVKGRSDLLSDAPVVVP